MKKWTGIFVKVKSKYWSRMHKYGVLLPMSDTEAKQIDEDNNNMLFMDYFILEMNNIMVTMNYY